MVTIKIKRLTENATIPTKAHPTDACFDITATSGPIIEEDTGCVLYHTGIALEIPEGYCAKIYPRSSITKYGLLLKNSVGVIDSEYRGEILLKFVPAQSAIEPECGHGLPFSGELYSVGDKIGQLMIEKLVETEFVETDELSESDRNTGGFGSTGK